MVEEKFEQLHSKMLQIDSILLLSENHSFAMVEENFEQLQSKRHQIDSLLPDSTIF